MSIRRDLTLVPCSVIALYGALACVSPAAPITVAHALPSAPARQPAVYQSPPLIGGPIITDGTGLVTYAPAGGYMGGEHPVAVLLAPRPATSLHSDPAASQVRPAPAALLLPAAGSGGPIITDGTGPVTYAPAGGVMGGEYPASILLPQGQTP